MKKYRINYKFYTPYKGVMEMINIDFHVYASKATEAGEKARDMLKHFLAKEAVKIGSCSLDIREDAN
jgi:hypothetical protein